MGAMALRTTMKRVGYDGKLEGKDEDEEEDDDDVIKVSNANGRTMPIVSMMMATTVRTITDIMTMRTAMTMPVWQLAVPPCRPLRTPRLMRCVECNDSIQPKWRRIFWYINPHCGWMNLTCLPIPVMKVFRKIVCSI